MLPRASRVALASLLAFTGMALSLPSSAVPGDADDDGKPDASDVCPMGETGWTSSPATDHDDDGCRDDGEDTNDDSDLVPDSADFCPRGHIGWIAGVGGAQDHDGDGCRNDLGFDEDADDDNDSVGDPADSCRLGAIGWVPSAATDYDSDGCRDSDEDPDIDNDGVANAVDDCSPGELGWISGPSTDADADGCRDATEDPDGGVGAAVVPMLPTAGSVALGWMLIATANLAIRSARRNST